MDLQNVARCSGLSLAAKPRKKATANPAIQLHVVTGPCMHTCITKHAPKAQALDYTIKLLTSQTAKQTAHRDREAVIATAQICLLSISAATLR